ncbi:MotA/TolQ/ExbB proton channel family protein [Bacteriovoracales bacterium]|nr:MotA/TolQ/ExbB proton channel family protein [Bacteriovoracales bacterium]
MAGKVLSIFIVGFAFVAAILAGGDLRAFLDVPSALFVGSSFGLLFRVNWKIASPMSEKVEGSDITGWELLGYTAIFMGLVGTLVGTIIMLGNLSNPASIGPAMAISCLTTFYGSLIFLFSFLLGNFRVKSFYLMIIGLDIILNFSCLFVVKSST